MRLHLAPLVLGQHATPENVVERLLHGLGGASRTDKKHLVAERLLAVSDQPLGIDDLEFDRMRASARRVAHQRLRGLDTVVRRTRLENDEHGRAVADLAISDLDSAMLHGIASL